MDNSADLEYNSSIFEGCDCEMKLETLANQRRPYYQRNLLGSS